MGFFSYKCAKSKISIPAHPWAGFPTSFSEVVQVLPDDATITGVYDGYGKIGTRDTAESLAPFITGNKDSAREDIWKETDGFKKLESMMKIVLQEHYKGEKFDDLPVSEHDQTQGYFYGSDAAKELYKAHNMEVPEWEIH